MCINKISVEEPFLYEWSIDNAHLGNMSEIPGHKSHGWKVAALYQVLCLQEKYGRKEWFRSYEGDFALVKFATPNIRALFISSENMLLVLLAYTDGMAKYTELC